METKTKEVKKEVVKEQTTKVDLMSALNQRNKSASVSRAIKNKYIYPKDLEELKSTDKIKKSYRRKIQKTILYYLSIEKPTKESKKEFNEFCLLFINDFKNLNESAIENLFSFHNEKQKESANNILKLYKQLN